MLKLRKSKTEKGITLIALIITIVVLLILAVVAITAIRNEGIIGHAQNTTSIYNNSVTNEQGMLEGYEDFLNAVEPKVGQYVKYNVSYTDMYSSSKTFGETDGWRYLGKDEAGKHLIISTGIPMILKYDFEEASDGNCAKWWDDTQPDAKAKMVEGLKKNLANIPYATVSAGTTSTSNVNTMIGLFNGTTVGSGDSAYDVVGDYFKATGQLYSNKIEHVRTLTCAEVRKAINSARRGESGYTELEEIDVSCSIDIPEDNSACGLFDLARVRGLSRGFMYWLATHPNTYYPHYVYAVSGMDESGMVSICFNGLYGDCYGVRPVVRLSSGAIFTDANGDGVLEIK